MNYLTEIRKGRFNDILTKYGDENSLQFKTLDENKLQKISSFMPEINRASSVFAKSNSQTTTSLMTMNMIDGAPIRVLRQILAQIEKKRAALKESCYKNELLKIKLDELKHKLRNKLTYNISEFEERRISLKIEKRKSDVIDGINYIEAALKEIGHLQEQYKAICKNNNIPENWDEKDFEEEELKHHIRMIFKNAIRDKMSTGACNHGTMEYMEQFGINPITAYAMVDKYLNTVYDDIQKNGKPIDINVYYTFLDEMVEIFKNEYKKAMSRLGIDSITSDDYLYMERI